MAKNLGRWVHTLLSLSVLAVLTGCGGPAVTGNPLSPGGSSGTTPGTGTNPGSNPGTNPNTPNPPSQAIRDPASNTAVLSTTRTRIYNLDTAALNASGWQPAALLEHEDNAGATSPRVAFDASGNGFAVWALGSDVLISRYTAASASWSAPVALDEGIDTASQVRIAIERHSGNAVASWTQSDGVAESIYASRFDASTDRWSPPQALESGNGAVAIDSDALSVSIAGSHAAVAWRQHDDTAISIFLSRLVAGDWTAAALVDTTAQEGQQPQVAIDSDGNATVAWRQLDVSRNENRIHARRWDNTAQTLGPVLQLNNDGDRLPRLQFDAQGNGILLWSGNGVFARRFDVTSGQWGGEVRLHNDLGDTWGAELALDAAGNAMVVWVERVGPATSLYARRYNSAANIWSSAELLETSNVPVSREQNPTVSLAGNEAVVAWIQDTPAQDVYAIKRSAGTWGPVTPLDTSNEAGSQLTSTVDALGNAAVLWVQFDAAARSIYQARYLTSNFVVPSGGTWQWLANTLYGVNSIEAGNALQAALGGGALSEGMILSGFPATLSVTTTTPAYYTVLATDTWSHIAQRVYGVTDVAAITQLRTLLGNPTLTTGMQLVVPTTFQYTTSANYRAPLDWARVNTITTTYHQLDLGPLTVPLQDWSQADVLETRNDNAGSPRIAFDVHGNGIAVWAQGNDVIVRRYLASSTQWSAPAVLDSNPNDAATPRLAIDRATGNAIVAWTQGDGVAPSLYVSSFDAGGNSWSAPQLIETSNNAVTLSAGISLSGEHASVTWLQSNGTPINDVYLSRLVAGTWTTPMLIDTGSGQTDYPDVRVDGNGNATAAWRQLDDAGTENIVYTRRWDNTTLALGPVVRMNTDGGDREIRLGFDAPGNGMLLWRGGTGDGTFVRHFDVASGQWGPQLGLHTAPGVAGNGELSVDASGDALATWTEIRNGVTTIYARHYDASTATWEPAMAIVDDMTASYMTVSLTNGSGVVAWVTEGDEHDDLYAARLQDGVWGAPALLETRSSRPMEITSAIDPANNAAVLWVQGDDMAFSIFHARSNSTPYYLVPAGATWQSIASTLYGVDSGAAGQALAAAMLQPALTTGLHLQNLPATLVVTATVPAYYTVQSGDTWRSIALALYGTDRSEAATALWNQLGRPPLTVSRRLNVPSELSYTVEEA